MARVTSPDGYQVLVDELTTDAKHVRSAADKVSKARSDLSNNGTLPSLDPLGRALGSCLVAFMSVPLVGVDVVFTKQIQDLAEQVTGNLEKAAGVDPYPPIRNAWLDALADYAKLVDTAAKKIDDTATDYGKREQDTAGSFDNLQPHGKSDGGAPRSGAPKEGGSGNGSYVGPNGSSDSDPGIYSNSGS